MLARRVVVCLDVQGGRWRKWPIRGFRPRSVGRTGTGRLLIRSAGGHGPRIAPGPRKPLRTQRPVERSVSRHRGRRTLVAPGIRPSQRLDGDEHRQAMDPQKRQREGENDR